MRWYSYAPAPNHGHIYTVFTPDRVVSLGQSDLGPSWPLRSNDLSLCNYFCGEGFIKHIATQPHSLKELHQNISDKIAAISATQLRSAFRNWLNRAERMVVIFNICCKQGSELSPSLCGGSL
ncbi:hypothetical protein TNCV_3459531 [Trichonephila clavipes]|nr:hypothetical protein TNCV_3459531 [Trichonephila clavipes]